MSPGTSWCCSRERRGCSLVRHGPHFSSLESNLMGQLCCNFLHVITTQATYSGLQLICFLSLCQTQRGEGRVLPGCVLLGCSAFFIVITRLRLFPFWRSFPKARSGGVREEWLWPLPEKDCTYLKRKVFLLYSGETCCYKNLWTTQGFD